MAPSLPSCISSTFCSHRQASWFLLVTLAPFFLPFLFLCVPFLLLFLAPLSCFLLSVFLLYKVRIFIHTKRLLRFLGRADKGAFNKGCQPSTQPVVTKEAHHRIHPQFALEEHTEERRSGFTPEFEDLQDSNVPSEELCAASEAGGEGVLSSSVSDSEGGEEACTEAIPTHDGTTEFKELQDSYVQSAELHAPYEAGGKDALPLSVSDSAGETQGLTGALPTHFHTTEFEELQDSYVQSAELRAAYEARGEGVLPSSVGDSEGGRQAHPEVLPIHEGTTEFEKLQDSYAQSAELRAAYEARGAGILPPSVSDSEGVKQEHTEALPTHDGTTGDKTEEDREERMYADFVEDEGPLHSFVQGVESPTSYKAPVEVEGSEDIVTSEDTQKHLPVYEEATSSRTDTREDEIFTLLPEAPYTFHHQSSVQTEHAQGEEALQGGMERLESSHVCPIDVPDQLIEEEPWKDASDKGFELFNTQERLRQEPELSSGKESSLEYLDFMTRQEEKQDERPSFEPFEKGIQAGEPSYSSTEGITEWRKEAFAKEIQVDAQPHDWPAEELVESFQADWPVQAEDGGPCETSSVVELPPHMRVHGGIEFQDRIQEEQKILADINAIKKIVGYQGEPSASIIEEISALYTFLGMEPYYWAAEVEYFERARVEIELLKVVVGVK